MNLTCGLNRAIRQLLFSKTISLAKRNKFELIYVWPILDTLLSTIFYLFEWSIQFIWKAPGPVNQDGLFLKIT